MTAILLDQPTKVRFTLEDVRRIWDAGGFLDYPSIELIDGEVFLTPPDDWRATTWSSKIGRWLVSGTGPEIMIVPDKALAAVKDGLKPDFWVYPATQDPENVTGADCLHVIQVSDTTLKWEAGVTAQRYALGGVREYWVIDVEGHSLDRVHPARLLKLHPKCAECPRSE